MKVRESFVLYLRYFTSIYPHIYFLIWIIDKPYVRIFCATVVNLAKFKHVLQSMWFHLIQCTNHEA